MPDPTLRFPRRAHLRASAEFQAVFGEGSRVSGACLRLHARFAAPDAPAGAGARLGLTVAKRVDKRAVGRNRIRRVLREAFRLARAGLPPGDYVVLAKPEARAASNATLRADLLALLAKLARKAPPLPASDAAGTMPGFAPAPAAPPARAGTDTPSPSEGATAPPRTRP
jgi:ribonuclease P protein component